MKVYYDDKLDLLYIRFDDRAIEILSASRCINLESLLPVHYETT